MRALALYTRYGRLLARPSASMRSEPTKELPKLGKGAQPEWLGKKVLAAAGVSGAQRRTCPHGRRSYHRGQAHRLSGGVEGAGRGAVAQN
jgi:hypothetical protein